MALVSGKSVRKPWDTQARANKILVKKAYDKVKKSDESIKYFTFSTDGKLDTKFLTIEIYELLKGSFDKTNTKFLSNYVLHIDELISNTDLLNSYFNTTDFSNVNVTYNNFVNSKTYQLGKKYDRYRIYNSDVQSMFEKCDEINLYVDAVEKCLTHFKLTDIFYLSYLGVLHIHYGWPTQLTKIHNQKKFHFATADDTGVKVIGIYNNSADKKTAHQQYENDAIYIDVCQNLELLYENKIETLLGMDRRTSLTFSEAVNLLKQIDNAIVNVFNVPELNNKHISYYLNNPDSKIENIFSEIFKMGTEENLNLKIYNTLVSDETVTKHEALITFLVVRVQNDRDNKRGASNASRNHNYFNETLRYFIKEQNTNSTQLAQLKIMYIGILYSHFANHLTSLLDNTYLKMIRGKNNEKSIYSGTTDPRKVMLHNNLHLNYIKSRTTRFVPVDDYDLSYYQDSILSMFINNLFTANTKNEKIVSNVVSKELYSKDTVANNEIPELLVTLLKYGITEHDVNRYEKNSDRIVFINDNIWEGLNNANLTDGLDKKQIQLLAYMVKNNVMIPDDINVAKNYLTMNLIIEALFSSVQYSEFVYRRSSYNYNSHNSMWGSSLNNDVKFLDTEKSVDVVQKTSKNLDAIYAYVLDQTCYDAVEYYKQVTGEYEKDVLNEYDKQIENIFKVDGRDSKLDALFDLF